MLPGGWQILVDEDSRAKIRGSALELGVIEETCQPVFKRRGRQLEMAQNQQGHSVFLKDCQLCSVQAELGGLSKPLGCQECLSSATPPSAMKVARSSQWTCGRLWTISNFI